MPFHRRKTNYITLTELFGKVTRLLRKKAKMTIWWLNIDANSIRTHYLCSRSLCWVTKIYSAFAHLKKISESLKFRKITFFSLCMINFSQIIGLLTRKVRFKKVSERGFFSTKIENLQNFLIYVSYGHGSWCVRKPWSRSTF